MSIFREINLKKEITKLNNDIISLKAEISKRNEVIKDLRDLNTEYTKTINAKDLLLKTKNDNISN